MCKNFGFVTSLVQCYYFRLNEPLAKWWCYIYGVMLQTVETEDKCNVEELIDSLQKFMLQSNLAEYSGRLQLLYNFHCHAVHLTRSKNNGIYLIFKFRQQLCN